MEAGKGHHRVQAREPEEGLTHLFWVLLSSEFRAGVRAILNSQTFSLRVEEQIGKEEKNLKGQKVCRPGPLWVFCYFGFDSLFSSQVYVSWCH